MPPRPSLPRLVLTALAAFLAFAAIAPADIDQKSGTTFGATAGQEFSGKVAEFHATGKEPGEERYSATIYWGDGTAKSDGTITLKNHDQGGGVFEVFGKHTYKSGGTCKATVEIKELPTGQVVSVESTGNVSGTPGPECGGNSEPPPDPPKSGIADLQKKPRQSSVTLFAPQAIPGSTSITDYHWDFGDGKSADLKGATLANHIYDEPGTYTVSLTVTDANGLKDTATKQIEVLGDPKAVIGFTPDKGKIDTEFTLRGNKSTVPGGKIVRWEWQCNGKKVTKQDSADVKVKSPKDQFKCTFGTTNASVHLTVTSDSGEKASASTTMPVKPKFPPKAAVEWAPEDPVQDQLVTFDASASASHALGDGGGIKTFKWEWGDGTQDETSGPVAKHAFGGEPGKRTIKLTVTDAEGSTSLERTLYVSSKCVNDITVRGLQMRSGCFRQSSCPVTFELECWDGEPGDQTKLNGVDINTLQGGRLEINTKTGEVRTYTGFVRASYGPLNLGDGNFTIPAGGGSKVIRDSWRVGSSIHGFKAQSDPVVFNNDGSSFVPVNVQLPAPLQAVSGHIDIGATNDTPVYLGALHVEANDVPFPPFHINHVSFDYTEANNGWAGSLSLASPSGTFGGDVSFVNGGLNHLGLFGENLNIPIGELVFLQRIGGSYSVNPRRIDADVGFSAGPQVQVPGLAPASLLSAAGHWNLTFDGGEWSTTIGGEAQVLAVPTGGEFSATYSSIGRLDASFRFNTTLYYVFDVNAYLGLTYFNPSLWQAQAGIDICTRYIVHECANGELVVSSVGIAACIRLPWFLPDVGGYYKWGSGGPDFYFSGCSVGPVQIQGVRVRAAQSRAFTVKPGTQSEVLAFEGQDGAPKVTLEGPGGQRMETPEDGYDMTEPFFVSQEQKDRKTYVMISRPNAGKWTVTAAAGSTPIVRMSRAQGIPDPKVRAKVTGSGTKRRLEWSATPIQGQRITFSEQGAKAGDTIGTTTRAKGSFAFTPSDGPKGKRTIVAEVLQGGNPRATLDVASYSAPKVAPGRPRSLKLRRRGTSLVATWGAAPGASRYAVQVTLSDGRRIPILTGRRTVTIPGFAKTETATVTVAGYRVEGLNGPAAKATLKPPKAKKKRR